MTGTTQLCGTVRTKKSHLTATAETVALNTCFSQYQKHNNTKIYTSYCYVPCQVNIRTSSTRKGGQVKAESGTIDGGQTIFCTIQCANVHHNLGLRKGWTGSALGRRARQLSRGVSRSARIAVRFQQKTVGGMDCGRLNVKLGGFR